LIEYQTTIPQKAIYNVGLIKNPTCLRAGIEESAAGLHRHGG